MVEQLKGAHSVVDIVDRLNRNVFLTMLRYNVDKPEVLMLKFKYLKGNGRKEFSTNCLCDFQTRITYESTQFTEFLIGGTYC